MPEKPETFHVYYRFGAGRYFTVEIYRTLAGLRSACRAHLRHGRNTRKVYAATLWDSVGVTRRKESGRILLCCHNGRGIHRRVVRHESVHAALVWLRASGLVDDFSAELKHTGGPIEEQLVKVADHVEQFITQRCAMLGFCFQEREA